MAEKFLKIGLDFHGVINTNPSYFKDFTEYAEARGHRIYIITGGPAAKNFQLFECLGHQIYRTVCDP